MIPINTARSALLVAVLFLLSPLRGSASSPTPVGDLQPYRVVSPRGLYQLDISPSTPNGAGSCIAQLTKVQDREIVWKRKLPYTFWQACVNDKGSVGGFGYTTGPRGGNIPGARRGG